MFIKRVRGSFRRLQWKLTWSYTAVTVGALLVIVTVLGYLLFSTVLVPLDILNSVLSPQAWIQIVSENAPPEWRYVLSQDPIDTELVSLLLRDGDLQITHFDLFRIGDLQIRLRTAGQGSVLLVDPDGILLGSSSPELISGGSVGQSLDMEILPGLEEPLKTALSGEVDPERLFVTIEPNESFYFALPYFDEANREVLGVAILYFESLPTENDIPDNLLRVVGQSVLVLLLSAGLIGTIFGFLTARGIVSRLQRVTEAAAAWSRGDFSTFIEDPVGEDGDEISQLSIRLDNMARQLQLLLKRSKQMAVSEERNRLARELHDSAKQEALAASFQIGTALTLFERDSKSAKSHLEEADYLVDSVRGELTDLIHELRPPSMEGVRFDETIHEYMVEWAHQTGIKCGLKLDGYVDLPLEIKQAIYRIMQEALANVARHSSAEHVQTALRFREDLVEFCLRDNGCGFDVREHHEGMGLDSMRERAEAHEGHFRIESEIGQGTEVCVTFPIE
jgi:NarL family two-component system sensor histidine kinase LiaS